MRWKRATGGAAAVLVAGGAWMALRPKEKAPVWRVAKVERGGLRQRITATGTLSGLVQINVGTQISGTISGLYVDYNSVVKKGQRIAQIDPTVYEASVRDAEASVAKAQATLEDAARQFARNRRLFEAKLISEQDLQASEVAEAKAAGDLGNAKATLSRAKANLGYCTITAPVNGVVVSRAIDLGQTVAASFNTPNLFVIAQDLTKMKLEASIDEADIGQVKEGQMGLFTVDSFPDTQFRGRVSQVRLEPITQQNVVTYKVVIAVDNSDLKLRPGMTANVSITTQQREDVLKVPSAALRFNPLAFLPAEERGGKGDRAQKGQGQQGQGSAGQGRSPGAGPRPGGGTPLKGMVASREDRIWILKDGKPSPLPVKTGITDGQSTEVSGEGVAEGMQVLVGVEEKRAGSGPAPLAAPGGPGMRR